MSSHATQHPQAAGATQPQSAQQPAGNTEHQTSQAGDHVFDILGIGVGPFNLGLAALAQPLVESGELTAIFFDSAKEFCWHPGVMFPNATIQVPFLADLVTMADPTSQWSFVHYLKTHGRLYPFYIRESFYPYRKEYSDYCAWVAQNLSYIHWSTPVNDVRRTAEGLWEVHVGGDNPRTVLARNVVNGTGTQPYIPESLRPQSLEGEQAGARNNQASANSQAGANTLTGNANILHSSEFLHNADRLMNSDSIRSITIVGSGQSAAEIYRHLMEHCAATGRRLDWFTRSPRFFPMEYTALTLELTSTDYVQHFHTLPEDRRDQLNRQQRNLYKGISGPLIDEIFDTLYQLSITTPITGDLRPDVTIALARIEETGAITLRLTDNETGKSGEHTTDAVILATGYGRPDMPPHLAAAAAAGDINRDAHGRMAVDLDFTVNDQHDLYVLNAEEHTHSLNAPDLGMGPWRNSIILNQICGREVYTVEDSWTFQTFGGRNL